ncbi:hypothetical protein S40293_06444 [Stachybotrys chartarum IBT 40293]|nr:hypothetical protein S40293_06444 [Stachybotrys chartarum IBT 40293]
MVKTKILIISDTHGVRPEPWMNSASVRSFTETELSRRATSSRNPPRFPTGFREPLPEADVVLHCGDLTKYSREGEFRNTFGMLRAIRAPLKLVIAGNHDGALDEPFWVQEQGGDPAYPAVVKGIIDEAAQDGVRYLTEGVYTFDLQNGARLTIYASPYTPVYGGWGFQYHGRHDFAIPAGVDVAMTHGPPLGVLDMSNHGGRAGCGQLFRAIHSARPKIHCFGHIHEAWGALLARWQTPADDGRPARYATAVDADASRLVKTLAQLWPQRGVDDDEAVARKTRDLADMSEARSIAVDLTGEEEAARVRAGEETLFVNAAIMDTGYWPSHLPWTVDVDLDPTPMGSLRLSE